MDICGDHRTCILWGGFYPGDLIGSGTVGSGCLLELNGTAALSNPGYIPQWLKAKDEITMTISGLGELNNVVIPEAGG